MRYEVGKKSRPGLSRWFVIEKSPIEVSRDGGGEGTDTRSHSNPQPVLGRRGRREGGEEVYLPQVEERMVWCGLRGVECTGRDWARIQEKTKLGDGERGGYTRPRMCVLNPVLRF